MLVPLYQRGIFSAWPGCSKTEIFTAPWLQGQKVVDQGRTRQHIVFFPEIYRDISYFYKQISKFVLSSRTPHIRIFAGYPLGIYLELSSSKRFCWAPPGVSSAGDSNAQRLAAHETCRRRSLGEWTEGRCGLRRKTPAISVGLICYQWLQHWNFFANTFGYFFSKKTQELMIIIGSHDRIVHKLEGWS